LGFATGNCVELEDKEAASQLLSTIITHIHVALQVPFLIVAKELIACHGSAPRLILKLLDPEIHDKVLGACSGAPDDRTSTRQPDASVNGCSVCAVCMCMAEDGCDIISLPCGHCMCEDCFTARFLREHHQHVYGVLPESETPKAQTPRADDTPSTGSRSYFVCPVCRTDITSSGFWDAFPLYLSQAQRCVSSDSKITLQEVHARIVASVLRTLRSDPRAAVARCNAPKFYGRYAFAMGLQHEVFCFGSAFDNIIVARERGRNSPDVLLSDRFTPQQITRWKELQNEVKMHDTRSKRLNRAGAVMQLQGGRYFCGKSYGTTGGTKCSPGSACLDCIFSSAELGEVLQPVFVADNERGDTQARLRDIRMCPR